MVCQSFDLISYIVSRGISVHDVDLCYFLLIGKWPFWISPRQVLVVPVVSALDEYGQQVKQRFHDAGFMTDIDVDPGRTLNKKIRNGQLQQYNFILGKLSNEIFSSQNRLHSEPCDRHFQLRISYYVRLRIVKLLTVDHLPIFRIVFVMKFMLNMF